MRILIVGLTILAIALPATAQTKPTVHFADLEVSLPMLPGAIVKINWEYRLPNQAQPLAAAAEGSTTIHWTATCEDAGLTLDGSETSEVEFQPTQTEYSGSVQWNVTGTLQTTTGCSITAKADAAGPLVAESDPVTQLLEVQPSTVPANATAPSPPPPPTSRDNDLEAKGSPAPAVALLVAALTMALMRRRGA